MPRMWELVSRRPRRREEERCFVKCIGSALKCTIGVVPTSLFDELGLTSKQPYRVWCEGYCQGMWNSSRLVLV